MLTGKRLVGDMENSFAAGADLYVNKPYEWARLQGHIKALIG
jgi:DNA-binding response OmpR family regulator